MCLTQHPETSLPLPTPLALPAGPSWSTSPATQATAPSELAQVPSTPAPGRPALEVASIFRAHLEAFNHAYGLSDEARKTLWNIMNCRTAVLGGHLQVCDTCDFEQPAYNSCRNRHCPKCQSLAQAQWLETQLERVLPTRYFHVVFTLPGSLRELVRSNRKVLFGVLFQAASQTLLELGASPERLGGQLGFTAVLHTWTRALDFHPHLHCIVTGGALSRGETPVWREVAGRYLFPQRVMEGLFRGKFLDLLSRARGAGKLVLEGPQAKLAEDGAYLSFKGKLYRTDWQVYAKQPFGGATEVMKYLGRYTHRVGLSNRRLISHDEAGVTFKTKHGEQVTLVSLEFMRRFLDHVLPKGFVKIRHYGLHGGAHLHGRLAQARGLLTPPEAFLGNGEGAGEPKRGGLELPAWAALLAKLTGKDVLRCPKCGVGRLERGPLPVNPGYA